jgi:Flp pilus assembly protein TadG
MRRLQMKTNRRVKGICRFVKADSGGTLAELAIMVPILVVMLAAVAEFGRFFQSYSALAKGTRAASRYLSNVPYNTDTKDAARNIVVCGKTVSCTADEAVVHRLEANDVEITETMPPAGTNPTTVTVKVTGYTYRPIFDIGALLNNDDFSLVLSVSPSTTMYYMVSDTGGAVD